LSGEIGLWARIALAEVHIVDLVSTERLIGGSARNASMRSTSEPIIGPSWLALIAAHTH
jgi:hypothetical protein